MVKVDLITGFLGSGKTTFIKRYAKHLIGSGSRIAILENDYGAINVDTLLLSELQCDRCDVEMVVGGSDLDCHRRRFKSKLITLGMLGYDRIIVEPSGIYDVDEFFDVLHEDPLDRWYEPGSVISIVSALLEDDLSDESEYVLVSETANAGLLVLSRSQEASQDDIDRTLDHIRKAYSRYQCSRVIDPKKDVLCKDWKDLNDDDYSRIMSAGVNHSDHVKRQVISHNDYDSLFYMNVQIPFDKAEQTVSDIMNDPACGRIFRIKGFLSESAGSDGKTSAKRWIEINATKKETTITPVANAQEVIIVIGEDLDKAAVASHLNFSYGSGHEGLH